MPKARQSLDLPHGKVWIGNVTEHGHHQNSHHSAANKSSVLLLQQITIQPFDQKSCYCIREEWPLESYRGVPVCPLQMTAPHVVASGGRLLQ